MTPSPRGEGPPSFHAVTDTFAASYRRAIANHGSKPFVLVPGDVPVRKTFSEFDADVEGARKRLREGVGDARVLALIGGNAYEFMVYAVAGWLEGLSLCPMNPEEGEARIEAKIRQLGEPCFIGRLPSVSFAATGLGTVHELHLAPPIGAGSRGPARSFAPEQAMVLVFTSGSTGYSKIVEQSETAILSNVDALIIRHRMTQPICIGTPLPLFHVNALEFSFLCTLLSGQRLVLFRSFDLESVLETTARERIDVLSLVPHMIAVLCARVEAVRAAHWQSLRYVVSAASALNPAVARRFADLFPFRLIQGYGLSEAVNFSVLMPIDLPDAEYRRWLTEFERPSIGTALACNEVVVLDDDLVPKGEGEPGEICVRGPNVMSRYRGDTQSQVFAGGYLHTGDVGFFRTASNGERFFFISGRRKDTIKRFGETVSLVEVDDIAAFGLDVPAMAVGFEHDIAGEEIALVVELSAADPDRLKVLKKSLEERVPAILRPRLIAWTRQAIRTASGKPMRWKFKSACARHAERVLGQRILVIEEELTV